VLKKGDDNKSSKLGLTDEYKFGFPYERLYLQTRVKRNGDVKMHLDGGNVVIFLSILLKIPGSCRQKIQSFRWPENHCDFRQL